MQPKTSYRILDSRNRSGLFSVATVLLENLILAPPGEYYQVYLGEESLYFDADWGSNVWQYYFEQPLAPEEFEKILTQSTTEWGFLFRRQGLLDVSNRTESYYEAIHKAAALFEAKIGFSHRMQEHLNQITAESGLLEFPTLCVHRRATDWKHTEILPLSAYYAETDPFADLGWNIFLATDSNYSLMAFKRRYGKRLRYLKTARSWTGKSLHLQTRRRISPAAAGRDAVVDAYLLSRGNHLIRTRSNVTTFAQILNPSIPVTELDNHLEAGSG